jgi:phosphatidylinositol alpha-mannosyltransferase
MTALLLKPAPIVATFHRAGASVGYDTLRPLFARGARKIDRRFAVSEDARELAHGALGGTWEVVFNGVDVRDFSTGPTRKSEGPTIFFLARHEERKGLAVLLDAMAHLDSSIRLWIGGSGPETDALKSQHAGDPRMSWLGELDDAAKAEAMRGADVFCAPSLYGESFGIVLLEAMAAGTAVVASDLPGYARVARSGKDARLVPPLQPDTLATALQSVLGDHDARDRQIESGRERADHFSMRRLAGIYRETYADLVARTG